jgi:hypothetical protein
VCAHRGRAEAVHMVACDGRQISVAGGDGAHGSRLGLAFTALGG